MNFDITHILERWDYEPGQVMVRRFTGKDGMEKIQLRLDLGLLQMNATGRPDGKRPSGHPTLHEYFQKKLSQHLEKHDGSDEGFTLDAEDCAKLQLEAIQFHHRYICLLQLNDFEGVVADTTRNLAVFDFVGKYAENDELAWSLQQFRPQLLMIHTRARATNWLQSDAIEKALQEIATGIEHLTEFYHKHNRPELPEQSAEIQSLQQWAEELRAKRPLSEREKLELALLEAVKNEDYEEAARLRDTLKKFPDHKTP